MAQRGVQMEKISCSICLDLLKDPATIPCGHSYCMDCIKDHWDVEGRRGNYSCPQCRETFSGRPVLKKNTILADLVEDLKNIELQAAAADHCYAGPEDVACDVCTGRKMKAVKSCQVCLVSFCENHQQAHCNVFGLKKHDLVDQLQERRQQIQQRIQDQEKDVKMLQQEVEAINLSADKAVKDSEKIFTDLIRLIQKRSSDVKQQIRSQQETDVREVKELQKKLEQEITELKRKEAELHELQNTEDLTQFLQNYPSLPALSESTHSSSINIRPPRYFEDVTAAVSEFRDLLDDILRDTGTNISPSATRVEVLESEPNTRNEFLKYFQEITLDPNTANKNLLLSKGNRMLRLTDHQQPYPDHPDRFTFLFQVLSRESLTGRSYWEVEWRGEGVCIAVSYRNIGKVEGFGFNDKSWSLYCDTSSYTFCHNRVKTPVPGPVSSRIGVYLDHRAGILSFYSVSETMTLLHRVQTTFTQPLYAGVRLYGSIYSLEFINLK
ncbi:tripartite motif-containing protein 16-like protein [Cyprinodon tularosa]|uniref:tripartite motif-containing protein 16-like protein n=1 Tax=Cyprinodon tularosa TaxID=77115 RepID=UPI0018E1FB2C|nr:tripartite motif-containing protein 16-like protein [Cyprinodon tularosa]